MLVAAWVKKFREEGYVTNAKPVGRPKTSRTPLNINRVQRAITRNPRRSIRKHAQALNLSRASIHRILKQDLHFHPYKIQLTQYVKDTDYLRRKNFAEAMMTNFWNDGGLEGIIFSDEAHFHLNGDVNKQNARYWAPENPRERHQRPLHSPKVTVWCGMSAAGIIGPYFFEDAIGRTLTVTSRRYTDMVQNWLRPELVNVPGYDPDNTWFQQDGATPHTAAMSMEALRGVFPGTLISHNGDILYPARSPELTPLDFFLWGYLKSIVYTNPPANLVDLKENIRAAIANIPADMCRRAFRSLRSRLQECYERDGQHLDDIVFKT